MLTSTTFQSDVLSLLNALSKKKAQIEERYKAEIAAVDREIDAVNLTASLMRGDLESTVKNGITAASEVSLVPISDLMGKTSRQALIEIAKRNGGIVHVATAKKMLIDARVLKPTKNVWGAIYTTLTRSTEFEKGQAPGTFRMVSVEKQDQASLLN